MPGIPVVIASNGLGIPVKQVDSGAPVMTVAANGLGTPIVLSDLGTPFVVEGGAGSPTIAVTSGGGYAGSTYTATPGDSSTSGQWLADGVDISGATALTFVMTTAYEGASITFRQGNGGISNAIHLFVPADLGSSLISHNDALASATITQVSGAVSAWASRVGSHTLAQAASSARPVYSATARNGLPGIAFDGVDDYLAVTSLPASFPIGNNPATVFIMGYDENPPGQAWRAFQYGGTSGNARHVGGSVNGYTLIAANAFNVNNGASVWRDADKIITGRFIAGSISLNTDGNEIGTTSVTMTTTNALGFFLGARFSSSATECFLGTLQEALVFGGSVATGDEQKIQGYLAWRWGQVSLLASGHPYKSTPPTA